MNNTLSKLISIKGLKAYVVFLVLLFGGYFYLQLNGIQLYNSTKTEHEGNGDTYGSGHTGHHNYYHK